MVYYKQYKRPTTDCYSLSTNKAGRYGIFLRERGEFGNGFIGAYSHTGTYVGGVMLSIYSEKSDYRSGGDTKCNHRRSAWIEYLEGISFEVLEGLIGESIKWFMHRHNSIIKNFIYDNSGLRDMKPHTLEKLNKQSQKSYPHINDFFFKNGFKSAKIYSHCWSDDREPITEKVNNYTHFALHVKFSHSQASSIILPIFRGEDDRQATSSKGFEAKVEPVSIVPPQLELSRPVSIVPPQLELSQPAKASAKASAKEPAKERHNRQVVKEEYKEEYKVENDDNDAYMHTPLLQGGLNEQEKTEDRSNFFGKLYQKYMTTSKSKKEKID
jgi:hypothetical protein